MRYSIVVVTNRGVDALRPLFNVSHPDAELIIVDSNYNISALEELRKISHGYKQVVYAPVKARAESRKYDMMSALNTGYAYAEGEWTMRMDDCAEFKPDFFVRLEEDISYFSSRYGKRFVVRQLELEGGMGDVKWVSFHKDVKERYHVTPPGVPRNNCPMITAGIFFCHRDVLLDLNGFDERYDDGLGWNDNDMLFRATAAGYQVFYDLLLMIYRAPHVSSGPEARPANRELFFKIGDNEFRVGDYKSKNPFILDELSRSMMASKGVYVV